MLHTSVQQQQFDFSEDEKKYEDTDMRIGTSGLDNMGNTCYMNSIIQALGVCTEFRIEIMDERYINKLIEGQEGKSIRDTTTFLEDKLGFQLRRLFAYFRAFDGRIKESWQPYAFRTLLGEKNEVFKSSQQQDSHHVIQTILDAVHEEIGYPMEIKFNDDHIYKLFKSQQDEVDKDTKDVIDPGLVERYPDRYFEFLAINFNQKFHGKKYSFVLKLFGGSIISETTCPITKKSTHRLDACYYFTVPIPSQEEIDKGEIITPDKPLQFQIAQQPKPAENQIVIYESGHTPPDSPISASSQIDIDDELFIDDDDNDYYPYDYEDNEQDDEDNEQDDEDISDIELENFESNADEWDYFTDDFILKIKKIIEEKLHTSEALYLDDKEIWSRIKRDKKNEILNLARNMDSATLNKKNIFGTNIHIETGVSTSKINTTNYCRPVRPPPPKPKRTRDVTIHDCLKQNYQVVETLDEDNKWFSPFAKEKVCAEKRIKIWDAPEFFIVVLKRFEINIYSPNFEPIKKNDFVDFPIRGLDISEYIHEKNRHENYIYDLIAVNNHINFTRKGTEYGHYTTYALNDNDGKWYEFNDDTVTEIPEANKESTIKTPKAYVLFYKRRR